MSRRMTSGVGESVGFEDDARCGARGVKGACGRCARKVDRSSILYQPGPGATGRTEGALGKVRTGRAQVDGM
jgi:hypothetical protein